MKTITIQFYANATIEQTILVDDDVNPEEIVQKINNGDICTSLEKDGELTQFWPNTKVVGYIMEQGVLDGEYTEFELQTDV